MNLRIIGLLCFVVYWHSGIAQTEMRIEGAVGDTIRSVAEDLAKEWTPSVRVIPAVYIVNQAKFGECYFGLILHPSELKAHPPSSFFRLTDGMPVVVYYGFERNILPVDTQIDALIKLTENYLEPEESLANIHYKFWYCKFKGDKVVEVGRVLSKKQVASLPDWIPRR